jgi:probable rRNA maturation factor
VISVVNRQRAESLDMAWLRRFAGLALEECLRRPAGPRSPLGRIAEIEVSIVSDRSIARVHRDFMGIAGPTDVITFEHGEIVIGAGTARRQAREFGQPLDREIALYIVHGLLHLQGWDDRTAADRARMQRAQSRVMKTCLARISRA